MATVKLVARLTDTDGNPLSGETITFSYSYDGVNYTQISQSVTDSTGTAIAIHETTQTTYYMASFGGDSEYEPASAVATYTPPTTQQPSQQTSQHSTVFIILLVALSLLLFSSIRGNISE